MRKNNLLRSAIAGVGLIVVAGLSTAGVKYVIDYKGSISDKDNTSEVVSNNKPLSINLEEGFYIDFGELKKIMIEQGVDFSQMTIGTSESYKCGDLLLFEFQQDGYESLTFYIDFTDMDLTNGGVSEEGMFADEDSLKDDLVPFIQNNAYTTTLDKVLDVLGKRLFRLRTDMFDIPVADKYVVNSYCRYSNYEIGTYDDAHEFNFNLGNSEIRRIITQA